jgi:hypothetical protein
VRWSPAANGGSPITAYRVQVLTGTTVVRTVLGLSPTATSTVVTGLTNGTAYTFRVYALNAVGLGALSAPSNVVTPVGVPAAPTAVTGIAGTAGGIVTARVQWTAGSTGGAAINGYQIRALRMSPTGAVLATLLPSVQPGTSRGLTMTLPAGNYRFTVQARNAVGWGAQSARSNQVAAR